VCISPYPTSNQSFQQSHNGIMRTHRRSQFAKIVRIAGHKLNAFGSSDSKMLLLLPTVDPRDRLDINQNLPSWNLEAFAPLVTDGRTCSSRTRKSRHLGDAQPTKRFPGRPRPLRCAPASAFVLSSLPTSPIFLSMGIFSNAGRACATFRAHLPDSLHITKLS
jgi:hypothetical protein